MEQQPLQAYYKEIKQVHNCKRKIVINCFTKYYLDVFVTIKKHQHFIFMVTVRVISKRSVGGLKIQGTCHFKCQSNCRVR